MCLLVGHTFFITKGGIVIKINQHLIAVCVIISIFVVGCDSSYDESFQNAEPDSEINTVEVNNSIGDDIIDEMDEAEKAAEEKAAAEKASAEKAAAEKAAAEKAAAEKAAAEKAAAEKAAAEKAAEEKAAAEKAAAEKAAAEKAAAEKAAAEKAAAEKAASEKAAAEKAAAEKAAAEKAAAEKAAAEKAAAEKAAAEKEALEKAAAEEAAKYKIKFIDFPSVFYRNEIVTITIQGKPNTEYDLDVYYKSGKSKAKGLEEKTSDSNGIVSWTFKIGGKTTEEYTPHMIISGNNESVRVEFYVADGD